MKRLRAASAWCGPAVLAAACVLGGCASAPTPQAMTVAAPAKAVRQFPYSVGVVTAGGRETSPVGDVNISDTDLKAAIEASLRAAGLFREVVQGGTPDYRITVSVTELRKPVFGASFTVHLEAGWSVVRVADGQVAMRRVIASSSTATMSDAFVGAARIRLAVEGAARANVEQGLAAIAALPLGAPG